MADDERAAGALTELDSDECFRLVATLEVGRITVAMASGPPQVLPGERRARR